MAKPIFVMQLTQLLSPEQSYMLQDTLERELPDYHVLLVSGCNEQKVQVFSDKEIEPIQFDELKKIINESHL